MVHHSAKAASGVAAASGNMGSFDGRALLLAVGSITCRFERDECDVDVEGWESVSLADGNVARSTLAMHDNDDGTLSVVLTYVGEIHGDVVCILTHPRVVAMLKDTRVHFTIQNMFSSDPERVHALVALLTFLDAAGGVVHHTAGCVTLQQLATLLFMIVWVSADAHDCLPFRSDNAPSAYCLLFQFCCTHYATVAEAINPKQLSAGSNLHNVYSVRKVAALDNHGDVHIRVPWTPGEEDRRANIVFLQRFIHYAAGRAAAVVAASPHLDMPTISVAGCHVNVHRFQFKPIYFKMGLLHSGKSVVWTTMLIFHRMRLRPDTFGITDALHPDALLAVLALVDDLCVFNSAPEEDTVFDQESEPDTDWDEVEDIEW